MAEWPVSPAVQLLENRLSTNDEMEFI